VAPSGGNAAKRAAAPQDYREAIDRARALIEKKDRARACAILSRALAREPKGSSGSHELAKALDELSEVFFTEQGQASWSLAESLADSKPREALDPYQAALRLEDGNLAALKGLARAHLSLAECERADSAVKQAEAAYPLSAEARLLRLQVLDCQKNYDALDALLLARDLDMEPVERSLKSLQAKALFRKKDGKKAKAFLNQWEQSAPDYPELFFWKWKFSAGAEAAERPSDRPSAVRYAQACQNLTPRKRKAFRLDVDLCKGKDAVDAYLKSAGLQPSMLSDQPPMGVTPSE
jgi:predicted Zn-dependent protease